MSTVVHHQDDIGALPRRRALRVAVFAILGLLVFRLYQLQMFYNIELGRKSTENTLRAIVREPLRGYVFDRKGHLVVDVGPSYSVTITPAEYDPRSLPILSSILGMDTGAIKERVQKGIAYSRFSPTRIKRDISFTALSDLEEHLYLLPGLDYQVDSKRYYPTKAHASHLLGYCKEISDAQLARLSDYYKLGDLIGSSGLEASYEVMLRGQKGYEFLAVNARGKVIGSFEDGRNDISPQEGFDLILSLDAGLQAFAESLMTNYRGALVAIDPSTGGILSLVSKPDFDPSIFSGVTPVEEWTRLNTDTTKPLFNRATMTRYPPGSTYKMVLAAAALEEGIIDEKFRYTCYGAYRYGNRTFKDLSVHGSVNVVEAIQRSCNVFFYQLIHRVGFEKWTEYGRRFGFGQLTGADIGEETQGLLPSADYFDRVYGKGRWTQGYLVSLAIGQGELGVSPLQMAVYAAALANGGTVQQPHAVQMIRNKFTNRIEEFQQHTRPVGLSATNLALIREGMQRVVNAPRGTGRAARIPDIVAAGKTGTAENPHGEDHSWFVGFAPFEQPSIAIAVMLENAGSGGAKAAPIAGLVMEKYIHGAIKRYRYTPRLTPLVQADTVKVITEAR
ncbi:MAG: penicillin-binding protein 2 [Ignavibacteriales bacterium]|nr:penicillin-binding protein 2 [Ignavibacteriales bacterium]